MSSLRGITGVLPPSKVKRLHVIIWRHRGCDASLESKVTLWHKLGVWGLCCSPPREKRLCDII